MGIKCETENIYGKQMQDYIDITINHRLINAIASFYVNGHFQTFLLFEKSRFKVNLPVCSFFCRNFVG